MDKIFIFMKPIIKELFEKFAEIVINTLESICNFLFSVNCDGYNELIIALIGGELTLITLYFALIPTLIEKRDKEYYLNHKVTDFFLYYGKRISELNSTWIVGILLTCINILSCIFKFDNLSFILFGVFLVYFSYKIFKYLNFISNKDKIRKEIELVFQKEIQEDYAKTLEKMITITEKELNYNYIYETMDYLYTKFDDIKYFNEYSNKVLELNLVNKEYIYNKIIEYMKKSEDAIDYKFDNYQLFQFLRNSLNDFQKEKYYEFIHVLLNNNYQMCIKENNTQENMATYVFMSIDNSDLSDTNKFSLKNRILNNMHIHVKSDYDVDDMSYFNTYKYEFSILKYIIDNKDFELFKKYIRMNDINYNDDGVRLDVVLTTYIYLYYLVEKESEKYVPKEDKVIYESMLKLLVESYDFDCFITKEHYYKHLDKYVDNLKKINSFWEKFDYTDQYDVKTCVVDHVINTFEKMLILIFKYNMIKKTFDITENVLALFRFDIKNGKIEEKIKQEIIHMANKFDIVIKDEDYSNFEMSFMEYVEANYKDDELSQKIDLVELQNSLNTELLSIKSDINKLEIINRKPAKNTVECQYKIMCSKSYLDNCCKNNEVLYHMNLVESLERYIYGKIMNNIKNKIYYNYNEEQLIFNNIKKDKEHNVYFRPHNDSLGNEWKFGNKYNKKIEKFEIINTDVSDIRLLVKGFSCELVDIIIGLEELSEDDIEEKKKKYWVSRNKYCVKNDFGYDIYYTNKEIKEYLKNTEIILDIKVIFNLDIEGDNNIAIIRNNKKNQKYKKQK